MQAEVLRVWARPRLSAVQMVLWCDGGGKIAISSINLSRILCWWCFLAKASPRCLSLRISWQRDQCLLPRACLPKEFITGSEMWIITVSTAWTCMFWSSCKPLLLGYSFWNFRFSPISLQLFSTGIIFPMVSSGTVHVLSVCFLFPSDWLLWSICCWFGFGHS